MTKTTGKSEEGTTLSEEKIKAGIDADAKVDKEVTDKIFKVLEESNRALQPHLVVRESGITPSVRLVKIPDDKKE